MFHLSLCFQNCFALIRECVKHQLVSTTFLLQKAHNKVTYTLPLHTICSFSIPLTLEKPLKREEERVCTKLV